MVRHILSLFLVMVVLNSCQKQEKEVIIAFKVYCEMVANNAKPIAFHYPMESPEIDALWNDFTDIAKHYEVELYRETSMPNSFLFPKNVTSDKEVVLIYKGKRLQQYLQWKKDVTAYEGNDFTILEGYARRLGRLLGYTPQGINQLLKKNSKFKDLASFGVTKQTTHLFYKDVENAINFYKNIIGLPQWNTNSFQISADGFIKLHSFDENHRPEEPKSTAIALLTDQLPEWYAYFQKNKIPIKYTYKPKNGGAHDGFVAIDPGGYLLEIEQFKQNHENELFMAILSQSKPISTAINKLNFYGTITWTYHKDMLKMQEFYENRLGYEMVADQGWTKIYQTAPFSFIGLVDERRGMEDYADQKAVEITWSISEADTFKVYARKNWKTFEDNSFIGPENYWYHITSAQ